MTAQLWLRCCLLSIGALCVAACKQHAPEEDPIGHIKIYETTVSFGANGTPPSIATQLASTSAESLLSLPGRLVWDEDQTVRVFSPFSGRVSKIVAQLGDHVATGAPLALLNSPDYGAAQADFQKAVANRVLTEHAVQRAHDLFAHGVVAQKDVEQAEADVAAANAEAQRTERVLRTFNDSGDSVTQLLTLRSPINGVVVERAINPGQEIRPDQTNAAPFVITNPNSLWIQLDARETDLSQLKQGAKFTFRVATYPNDTFDGTIIRVADFVDPVTRTIKVLGQVDNHDRRLKGEMFATATLTISDTPQPEALASAVLLLGDKHYVFVRKGDVFERREVTVGNEQAGRVTILSGLKPSDLVVTDGALYLQTLLQSSQG